MIWLWLTQSKAARYAAPVLAFVAFVLWQRWDAQKDLRTKIEAEANKARIEHMKGAKNAESEIENLGDDAFGRSIDGLPGRDGHRRTVQ